MTWGGCHRGAGKKGVAGEKKLAERQKGYAVHCRWEGLSVKQKGRKKEAADLKLGGKGDEGEKKKKKKKN